MRTTATFFVLAAAGAVLWWLLRDLFAPPSSSRRPRCPVCGSRRVRPGGLQLRCSSCGSQFKPHTPWHLRPPTPGSVSIALLAFIALLALAAFNVIFRWGLMGLAQTVLLAAAGAGGIAAAIACFLKHRNQYGRN